MESTTYVTLALAMLVAVATAAERPSVRIHKDGSITSNSGPTSVVENLMHKRAKRAYIDSNPRVSGGGGLKQVDVDFIVSQHNYYRRMIPATNMQEVFWDTGLAASAQAHADACVLQHSSNRVNVGENIWASYSADFSGAIKMWYDEVYDSRCGCTNGYRDCCGHYTQLVWAETNRVGCGMAYCQNLQYSYGRHYNLVCQYSPAGNVLYVENGQFVQAPAFYYRGTTGSACSNCPSGMSCNDGLCR